MIKEISYASYVIPVRKVNGKIEIARIKYPDGYGSIGGRFDAAETNALDALMRELQEELGASASRIKNLVEIQNHFVFDVAPERQEKRGALKESHVYFIGEVDPVAKLIYCESDIEEERSIVWLPLETLNDEAFVHFENSREYYRDNVMDEIKKYTDK
jgi:8-oxo-dGTP pyrophosphatase MutT (NUDIX family)